MASKIKATVCIPTFNGEKYLPDIFRQLLKQKTDYEFEILVIDSGSTDRTLEIVNNAQKKDPRIRLHEIPNKEFGHGRTRNLAAQMARGEFVVYLTHDAIPAHPLWLYEMLKPFELNQNIVGVMGKQVPRPYCFPLLKYEIQDVFNGFGPHYATMIFYKDSFMDEQWMYDAAAFYSDVNSAARRDVLINEIPYHDVPYAEDQMFGRDVLEAGKLKAYAPRANVLHSNDIRLREYQSRLFDETIGYRKNNIKFPNPSWPRAVLIIIKSSIRDTKRILKDPHYSRKKKLYWILVNPLYHVEKWRGVKKAAHINLTRYEASKHSLEAKARKK